MSKHDFVQLKNKIGTSLDSMENLLAKSKTEPSVFFDLLVKQEEYYDFTADLGRAIQEEKDNWLKRNIENNQIVPPCFCCEMNRYELTFYLFRKFNMGLAYVSLPEKTFIVPKLEISEIPHNTKKEQQDKKLLSQIETFFKLSSWKKKYELYRWRFWKYKMLEEDEKKLLKMADNIKKEIAEQEEKEKIYLEKKDEMLVFCQSQQNVLVAILKQWDLTQSFEPSEIDFKNVCKINPLTVHYYLSQQEMTNAQVSVTHVNKLMPM